MKHFRALHAVQCEASGMIKSHTHSSGSELAQLLVGMVVDHVALITWVPTTCKTHHTIGNSSIYAHMQY